MTMVFRSTAIVVLLLISTGVYAVDLRTHIKDIEKKYDALTDLSADFTQETYVSILQRTVIRKGKLFLKKGGKLRIEYTAPDPQHYISDGKKLWTYTPGDATSLTEIDVTDDIIPPEALSFLKRFGRLSRKFSVSSSQAFDPLPKEAIALHLIPKSSKSPYDALDVLFDRGYEVSALILSNPSGNKTTYRFFGHQHNVGFQESLFQSP